MRRSPPGGRYYRYSRELAISGGSSFFCCARLGAGIAQEILESDGGYERQDQGLRAVQADGQVSHLLI